MHIQQLLLNNHIKHRNLIKHAEISMLFVCMFYIIELERSRKKLNVSQVGLLVKKFCTIRKKI